MEKKRKQPITRNFLKQIWLFFSRLNVAASLIFIVLALISLGSCFPQLSPSVEAEAEQLASWEANIQTRYGTLTDTLAAIGVFHWFHSPVFFASLALLAAATLICTLDHWRAVWRRAFHIPKRRSETAFKAAPCSARLAAPSATTLSHIAREGLEQRGFRVQSKTDQDAIYMRGDRNRQAALATLATHLAILLLLLGASLSSRYGWQEELTIKPGETVRIERQSGLALRNNGFAITRYPDGNVAAYEADVTIIKKGQAVMHGSIQVNKPLTYDGIGLYLRGYGETEEHYSITLLVGRDPGYGLVIVAGFLLLLGLTISFNFPRSLIHVQIEADGTSNLAGWAERRAYDFGREFTALVEELKRLARTEEENTS